MSLSARATTLPRSADSGSPTKSGQSSGLQSQSVRRYFQNDIKDSYVGGLRALASRLSKAHFEDADKTFENFDWTFNPKLPQEQLRDLATGSYLVRKEHILLCGPAGVGKTHLAEGLGHQAARQGYRVEFIKTSRLLSDLGGGHADGTWDGRLRHYLLAALLILDDFAMREYTTQQADDLYELISDRTRAGSIIVTSNRPPQDWYPLFPNPVLAEGALDRLLGRAHHLVLQGRSYRQFQRPDRTRQPLDANSDSTS